MSEEKIIQHTKKAISLTKDKTITLKEKIKGFLEEIIVIIIAVSITLAFHNWNDKRHENEMAVNFLQGIKGDLTRGTENLEGSIKQLQPTINYYDNVLKQIRLHKIDSLYVDTLSWHLRNTNYLVFDNSRFEGFKSSGYLRLIENKQLLKEIVTLYAVVLPFEKEVDAAFFQTRAQNFDQYIGVKADTDSSGNFKVSRLLKDKAVAYQYLNYAQILKERLRHREYIIKNMKKLISDINKEEDK